jgi:primosomal protein N''
MSLDALEALFEERSRKVSTYLQDTHKQLKQWQEQQERGEL